MTIELAFADLRRMAEGYIEEGRVNTVRMASDDPGRTAYYYALRGELHNLFASTRMEIDDGALERSLKTFERMLR